MPDLPAPSALYVHVPFCPHVCPYCDFHKMRRDEALVGRYLDRLEVEIAGLAARYGGPLETVYLGGGTPSHLDDAELDRVLGAIRAGFGGLGRRETTLEADPGTFDAARLARFRAAGVTRVSIGLQSTFDPTLRFLGRAHDAASGVAAVEAAVAADLDVAVDLIVGVAGRTPDADVARLAAAGVGHVSVYALTVEPFTPFARRGVRVDEDRAADDLAAAEAALEGAGFRRYEVSNYARAGREAIHNATYWHGAPFLAAGPSAAAYLPEGPHGTRVTAPPIKAWLTGDGGEREALDGDALLLERALTGLRTARGVDLAALGAASGRDVRAAWAPGLDAERAAGRLELVPPAALAGTPAAASLRHATGADDDAGTILRATPAGVRVLDAVVRRLVGATALP